MGFADDLKIKLKDWGATFTGYSKLTDEVSGCFPGLNYAVTIGIRLSDYIIDEIKDSPTYTYFHHYRSVNALIDQITLKGMLFMQESGGRALAVPASQTVNDKEGKYCGIFPHKTGAVLSGLGWIGRNGLFVSTDYGPRVRLGTILTDIELPFDSMGEIRQGCGECRKCVDNCPAIALTGNMWFRGCERSHIVDAKACSEYMNSKFKHIGRGSVCGICMRVCPYGQKK
jgi:epoxyqueuosine reductase QueG